MGLGVSLILIAAGAILTWAVDVTVSGVGVQAVGVILLVIGIIGGVLSMFFWSSWAGPGYFVRRRTTYTDEGRPYQRTGSTKNEGEGFRPPPFHLPGRTATRP
jgi:hypothetical protein